MGIHAKLLKFQESDVSIIKDATNPAFRSKYATLPQIIETVNPVLSKLDLVVVNSIDGSNVTTEVVDVETGEKVSASFPLFGGKAQEYGSSVTYARRYNLGALLNLHIDDDDDANATGNAPKAQSKEGSPFLDVINDIKKCSDLGDLKELYDSGKELAKTDKMKQWLNDEVAKRKSHLMSE